MYTNISDIWYVNLNLNHPKSIKSDQHMQLYIHTRTGAAQAIRQGEGLKRVAVPRLVRDRSRKLITQKGNKEQIDAHPTTECHHRHDLGGRSQDWAFLNQKIAERCRKPWSESIFLAPAQDDAMFCLSVPWHAFKFLQLGVGMSLVWTSH